MTNTLKIIQHLKSRCQRRKEERDSEALRRRADRLKSTQVNSQRKAG